MNQELTNVKEQQAARDFDLGTWLGRRQAFSMMAGRASAADIECLRTIREQRLYKSKSERWGDFCEEYVGASKTQVDRLIRYLEEFGPDFFELCAVTRISPDAYRMIAGHVSTAGLLVDGQTIPLTQENSSRISAAVAELRRRAEPPALPPPEKRFAVEYDDVALCAKFVCVQRRFEDLIASMDSLLPLDAKEKKILASHIKIVRDRAARLGVKAKR